MNNLTEIKISSINSRSKIGMIGDTNKGIKVIEYLINQFNFDFNLLFTNKLEVNLNTNVNLKIYDKTEEYSFIFNHLIKYIDYANSNKGYLIIFDDYYNNNYYLQKIYLNSNFTIINNNKLKLTLEGMYDYIFIFYVADMEIQLYLYNNYFLPFFNNFIEFKCLFDKMNGDPYKSPYISLVIKYFNDTPYLYYMKNIFFYEIEI
jgi:hypothetical protein